VIAPTSESLPKTLRRCGSRPHIGTEKRNIERLNY
jgi:hypothetical protein